MQRVLQFDTALTNYSIDKKDDCTFLCVSICCWNKRSQTNIRVMRIVLQCPNKQEWQKNYILWHLSMHNMHFESHNSLHPKTRDMHVKSLVKERLRWIEQKQINNECHGRNKIWFILRHCRCIYGQKEGGQK